MKRGSNSKKYHQPHDINVDHIQFIKPTNVATTTNKDNLIFIPISYENKFLVVKTSKTKVVYGARNFNENEDKPNISYTIDVSDSESSDFCTFIKNIEKRCIREFKTRIKRWINSYYENLSGFQFQPSIKSVNTNDECLKIKPIHDTNGKIITNIYNPNGQQLKIDDVKSGHEIIQLLELSGMWIKSKKVGLTWRSHQILIFPYERVVSGMELLDNCPHHTSPINNNRQCRVERKQSSSGNQYKTSAPRPTLAISKDMLLDKLKSLKKLE